MYSSTGLSLSALYGADSQVIWLMRGLMASARY
jgi:hypothetical protein